MRAFCALVVVPLAIGGCSLDVDGLTGGGDAHADDAPAMYGDPPGVDGSRLDPSDASVLEISTADGPLGTDSAGSSDAAAPADATRPPDAAGDATADAGEGAPPLTFCQKLQQPHLLCSDFDEGQSLAAGWTNAIIQSPGALALTTASAFSGPSSLRASTPAATGSSAYLEYQASVKGPSAHLEAEVLPTTLPANPSTGGMMPLVVRQDQGTARIAVVLYFSANQAYAQEEEEYPTFQTNQVWLTPVPTLGFWRKWAIDVDTTTTPATLKVTVDGVVNVSQPLQYAWRSDATWSFQVGDVFNYLDQAASAEFDNIVLHVK